METKINMTPEVIERLRRLASLVSKKGNSPRNGEKKEELDQNGNDNGKVKDTSNGGILLDTNGRLSPEVNRTENDVPTPGNRQTKGEGAIKMDMDVFRQILKEVIIKRTAAIEKRVMGDVDALKNQVFELEAQKKILQCDSERLQQTLNEISSKHEKQKVQMISCGTQVDMDLIQERPLSPEISKPIKPTSFSEKSIAHQMQNSKIVNTKEAVSDQVIAYKIDENEEKTSDRTKTPESRIHCNDSGIILEKNNTKTLSAKDTTAEILRRVSSQEQRRTTESLAIRDEQNELHVRQTQTTEFPHAQSIRRPNSELRVEGLPARKEQRNIYQQSARVDVLQHTQTRGPPPPRPTVSSGNPPVRGQNQGYFPTTSTESPLPRRPQFSSTRWLASQSQQPIQQVQASGNGPSQGQLVERVLYPSNGSQPGGNEYHNAQRVMSTQHQRYNERVQATDKPAESNGTVYVVQEYQVSRTRSAPLQPIAPAPPTVLRNATCPPVQSPGITSTASPSGSRPGEANAALVPLPVSNPSDTPAVRSGGPHPHLKMPPKPTASIVVVQDGIVLSWNMQLDEATAQIDNYELFACQDGVESTNPPIMWKKIGIVKALPLPMACTLTQFSSGNKYHFAVRAVDNQERAGPFSDPCTISLTN